MEKIFYPESIVIVGLSSKTDNKPKLILENLIRWGYMGRILGVLAQRPKWFISEC
jgi:acyl-CoA synthetase (NDP forming)